MAGFDLDAYLARIGWPGVRGRGSSDPPQGTALSSGSRSLDRDAIAALLQAHMAAIPFENLDVLLGRGISLDPAAIERKLVHDRRGGYCFEQNNLLLQVLRALSYRVTPIGARVRWQIPRDVVP
ncbi:MAG TPA: arylamine N-acetyltransferase, partial [Pseudolysinimonas sp.]|nr:arylamine N-acetyltransferase [Pseudolysinimonas sp.]